MSHLENIKAIEDKHQAYKYAFDNCTNMVVSEGLTTFTFDGEADVVFHRTQEQMISDEVRDWDGH